MTLTPEHEAAIRGRVAAATKGPWLPRIDEGDVITDHTWYANIIAKVGGIAEDVAFIAHARKDVPALLAELDRVREERDALTAEVERLRAENEQLHWQYDGNADRVAELEAELAERQNDLYARGYAAGLAEARGERCGRISVNGDDGYLWLTCYSTEVEDGEPIYQIDAGDEWGDLLARVVEHRCGTTGGAA